MDKLAITGAIGDARVTLSKMAKAASGEALAAMRGGEPAVGAPGSFGAALRGALNQVSDVQKASSSLGQRFQLGDPTVSLEETVIASQKASLAFQAALQVRNRVAQAYQEIMQMNV